MGCHCSQSFLGAEDEEEAMMAECEGALGFGEHAASRLCTEIRVLTVNQRLNGNRIRKLAAEMGLRLTAGQESKDDPIVKFYSKLGSESEGWESRKLALLALLLGKGASASKAELLFSFYDHEYNKYLTADDVHLLATEVCDLALRLLPSFCSDYLEHHGNLDAAVLVQNYYLKLSEAKPEAINQVKSLILDPYEDQVSLPTFKEKVSGQGLQCLFSARGLRKQTVARYKQVLRDQARHRVRVVKAVRAN